MRLHHVNLACVDLDRALKTLCGQYGFRFIGKYHEYASTFDVNVIQLNEIFFTLSKNESHPIDTVDDIAFSVESVTNSCALVKHNNGVILQQPHFIDCEKNIHAKFEVLNSCQCPDHCRSYVERAVVQSPVGNIKHTLLNTDNYNGHFLPGFELISKPEGIFSIGRIDHIALAVPWGEAETYMNWYKDCLNLSRFKTSVVENESGLVIRSNNGNGLRLLTIEEHPCSDLVVSTNEIEVQNDLVKIVFCESLSSEKGSDQIQAFLSHHKGAGVQHIAFHTTNIITDSQKWLQNGVNFIKPPDLYYKEIQLTLEKLREKDDLDVLTGLGILVDAEKHFDGQNEGFLYQVFTYPVLQSETFFFELIQRDNAIGFGAGNVSALWRALDAHLTSSQPTQIQNKAS